MIFTAFFIFLLEDSTNRWSEEGVNGGQKKVCCIQILSTKTTKWNNHMWYGDLFLLNTDLRP